MNPTTPRGLKSGVPHLPSLLAVALFFPTSLGVAKCMFLRLKGANLGLILGDESHSRLRGCFSWSKGHSLRLRVADLGLRGADLGLRGGDIWLRGANLWLRVANVELRDVNVGLRVERSFSTPTGPHDPRIPTLHRCVSA